MEQLPPPTISSPGVATLGDILAVREVLCPVPSSPHLIYSPQQRSSIIIPILQMVKLRLKNGRC